MRMNTIPYPSLYPFLFRKTFSSLQFLCRVRLFVTPWTAACQASLSITNSQSLPKLISIESVMPCNHLTLCHPLHLPRSILASIWVFSNESALGIRWPKYWSFNFSISPSNEYSGGGGRVTVNRRIHSVNSTCVTRVQGWKQVACP